MCAENLDDKLNIMESTDFVFYPYVLLLLPNDTCVALAFYSQNHGATNIDPHLDPTGQQKTNFVYVQAALRDVVNDRGPKMKGKEGK
jgi:hypothetical protein